MELLTCGMFSKSSKWSKSKIINGNTIYRIVQRRRRKMTSIRCVYSRINVCEEMWFCGGCNTYFLCFWSVLTLCSFIYHNSNISYYIYSLYHYTTTYTILLYIIPHYDIHLQYTDIFYQRMGMLRIHQMFF